MSDAVQFIRSGNGLRLSYRHIGRFTLPRAVHGRSTPEREVLPTIRNVWRELSHPGGTKCRSIRLASALIVARATNSEGSLRIRGFRFAQGFVRIAPRGADTQARKGRAGRAVFSGPSRG